MRNAKMEKLGANTSEQARITVTEARDAIHNFMERIRVLQEYTPAISVKARVAAIEKTH
jgi:hypothetical protein